MLKELFFYHKKNYSQILNFIGGIINNLKLGLERKLSFRVVLKN